jgi:hypothetical protein
MFDWDEADIPRLNFRQAAINLGTPSGLYLILLALAGKNMIN